MISRFRVERTGFSCPSPRQRKTITRCKAVARLAAAEKKANYVIVFQIKKGRIIIDLALFSTLSLSVIPSEHAQCKCGGNRFNCFYGIVMNVNS
jgi:hypothetical protein